MAMVCNAQMVSHVDERVELTSIVFRLAGMHEYINNNVKAYADRIDRYFEPYKDHPVIAYVQSLRQEYGLAYATVAKGSLLLSIDKNRVSMRPEATPEILNYAESRWPYEAFVKYVDLLNDFYRKTRFHKFFADNADVYRAAEQSTDALLLNINPEWFSSFFGTDVILPKVYAAVANGPHNYCVDDYSSSSKYGIVIGCAFGDTNGMPTMFPAASAPTLYAIVHEICHIYTSPIEQMYRPYMQEASEKIYEEVEEPMRRLAYGSPVEVIGEWFNNLCTILYFKECPADASVFPAFNFWTATEVQQGFVWMERSVAFMDNFYADRETYPYIDAFMPRLVAWLNFTADNFDRVLQEYQNSRPYVVSIFPSAGNIADIATELSEVRITFSQPMLTGVYSYNNIPDSDYKILPVSGIRWENDDRTIVLLVQTADLKQGEKYGIRLNPRFYVGQRYFAMGQEVDITYDTAPSASEPTSM